MGFTIAEMVTEKIFCELHILPSASRWASLQLLSLSRQATFQLPSLVRLRYQATILTHFTFSTTLTSLQHQQQHNGHFPSLRQCLPCLVNLLCAESLEISVSVLGVGANTVSNLHYPINSVSGTRSGGSSRCRPLQPHKVESGMYTTIPTQLACGFVFGTSFHQCFISLLS